MFYCGIDIAKYKHEATVIDEAGTALPDSISFANSKEGCEKLLALFERLGVSNAWNRGDVAAGLFQQGGDLSLQLRDLSFQKLHLLNELSDLESKGISGKAHTEGIGCRCFQLFSFLFS